MIKAIKRVSTGTCFFHTKREGERLAVTRNLVIMIGADISAVKRGHTAKSNGERKRRNYLIRLRNRPRTVQENGEEAVK